MRMKKLAVADVIAFNPDALDNKPRRVVLIGVFYSEPKFRQGYDGSLDNRKYFGETIDREITRLRFFDFSASEIIDVAREDIRKFRNHSHIINAVIHTARPFIVTMKDGGRFSDLPKISGTTGKALDADYFVIDNSFNRPIIVNGNGEYVQVKRKTLIEYKTERHMSFYNL